MRTLMALHPVVIGLIACATSVAQDLREVTAWQLFLQDAAALNHVVATDPPVRPPLQKALGLKAVAADYEMKNSLFLTTVRPLRMEALLESLDSGKVAENLARRIGELENEHIKMISDQIRLLRIALGDPRFEVLDTLGSSQNPEVAFSTPYPIRF